MYSVEQVLNKVLDAAKNALKVNIVNSDVTEPIPVSGTVSTTNDSNLLVASGTITFAEGDNTTVEKKTDAISLAEAFDKRPGDAFWFFAERPIEDTAGDLTINIYQACNIGGSVRDVLLYSFTIAKTTGAITDRVVKIAGLGRGSAGQIKVGAVFAGSDGGACTVPFAIYSD